MNQETHPSLENKNMQTDNGRAPKSTMVQYAILCQASYEEQPFNEVDSLILSWLSYLRIPEEVLPVHPLNSPVQADNAIFSDTARCQIKDLLKSNYYDEMLHDIWSPEDTLIMLLALNANPRFEHMRICLRREELDHEEGKQFAALTFQVTPELTYIAFRGTDKTLTGWEEDFRLALLDPVPAQVLAEDYLSAVGKIFRGSLIAGGHSKGGNLAVYASALCDQEVQERILQVYSHDGPGFLQGDLEKEGMLRIQPRIRKTAPQFSIFGMLLRQETEPKIIYSYEHGIMQHNAASWKTDGYGFAAYDNPSQTSRILKNKLNNWIEGLNNEQRKIFIDMVFRILNETGMEKFGDPNVPMSEIIQVVLRELGQLDPAMRLFLMDLIRQFLQASEENRDPNAERVEEAAKGAYSSPWSELWQKLTGKASSDADDSGKDADSDPSGEDRSDPALDHTADTVHLLKMNRDPSDDDNSIQKLMEKYDRENQ